MRRIQIPVRISQDELDQIDRHAGAMRLSRTEYVIGKLTDTLPDDHESTLWRLDDHETRLKRLEQLALGLE